MNMQPTSRATGLLLGALLFILPLIACTSQTNRAVANDIKSTAGEVTKSAGEAIEDSSVTAAVKGKILITKGLDSLDISVQTRNGVVYLTGMVDHESQIALAGRAAAEVQGVKQVVNNLKAF